MPIPLYRAALLLCLCVTTQGAHGLGPGPRGDTSPAALTLREEACAAARRELGDAHPCTVHQRGCLARTREHPYTLSRFSSSIRAKGVLVGLLSKPELNGSAVVVVGFDVAKGRYCVRHDRVVAGLKEISAGKPLAVKPACLVFEQGIAVIVEDLNAQPEWNGKRGLVKSFDSEKRRYQLLFTGRKKPLNVSPKCLKLEFAVEAEQRAREATRRARVEANVRAALAARSPARRHQSRSREFDSEGLIDWTSVLTNCTLHC